MISLFGYFFVHPAFFQLASASEDFVSIAAVSERSSCFNRLSKNAIFWKDFGADDASFNNMMRGKEKCASAFSFFSICPIES
ncbi:hypothetical protein CDAR_611281 [Caerostris darwini]|uniref:Secreted protein n=1 Tax=Caerostris darwini TaxID=1538125 RepID=A0AAV4UQE8_9ARAC|nr:hypothetical protein CDAR_611281 [Caerostris darwini]